MTWIDSLSSIMQGQKLRYVVDPQAIAKPSFLDATYNFSLIACAFAPLGQRDPQGRLTANVHAVRLAHFIAVRPALLPEFLGWAQQRLEASDIFAWPHLPRGYLTDETQIGAVDYLGAVGELTRVGSTLVVKTAAEGGHLEELAQLIDRERLFSQERVTIKAVSAVRLTKAILGIA